MRTSSSVFVAFAFVAFVATSLTACSIEPSPLTTHSETKGANGKLSFEYVSSQCGAGCALDRPAVLGSLITVQVSGGDPSVRYDVRVASKEMGTITRAEFCSCTNSNGTSGESVDPSASCGSSATKSCQVLADVQTLTAEEVTLLVVDPSSGATVDSVGFSVRPADRIDSQVSVNGNEVQRNADGTYSARPGDKVSVHSVVYSGTLPMVFTRHGLIPQYADMNVLASAGDTGGATDVEDAVAKGAGTASLTMQAHGASSVVNVRVSP